MLKFCQRLEKEQHTTHAIRSALSGRRIALSIKLHFLTKAKMEDRHRLYRIFHC